VSRLLLVVLIAFAGCTLPRAERPLGPVVHLIVEDGRPSSQTVPHGFLDPVMPYVVPIIPWFLLRDDPLPRRSLAPELVQAVADTGLFTRVLGPSDPWPERLAAPFTLRVVLFESEVRRRRTTYGLGIVGLLLHALGAPQEYERASIALQATCTASDGRHLHWGEGSDGELMLEWIYEDWSRDESEANLRARRSAKRSHRCSSSRSTSACCCRTAASWA
jgi:hypothetical protein